MLLPITRRQIAAVLAPKQATRLAMFEVLLFTLGARSEEHTF